MVLNLGGMSLRVNLNEEETRKLEELKKRYGLRQATELVRLLITLHYEQIKGESSVNPLTRR
jgi:hypothetical protein